MDVAVVVSNLSANPALAIPLLFAAGVLTSLTPCVYPMIPITAAIVGGSSLSGAPASRFTVAGLTFSYVIGLALVYAALGTIAGLTGSLFGSISTNPWLYFGMANLLVYAALVMLDVLPLPISRTLIARAAGVGGGGRYGAAFGMGAASGLVAAPCSAPVMAAVLTWVGTTRSGVLGFVYLFAFSLGMCALLVVVGLSSGHAARLPKAGPWMLWVKRGFAVIMLGVAEYYLIQMGRLLI